ncbi:MAG TPA: 3-phosphoshikimate 1-carboxyvinyltransferase [Firmicutes bacterium]|jgi:3-phosphoshikimate 1-carboxyvinyltransferase|nr:3-phosphoshikimate 1-carboxyvinyltransferase [Bacillota bacterium]
MSENEVFEVPSTSGPLNFSVTIPGSKSLTNRALLIAALGNQVTTLSNVLFSDDSKHFMDSLVKLGFKVEVDETRRLVSIRGQGGKIPNRQGEIYVGSAGTAARFLTAMLALSKGRYLVQASPQMTARPMKPLLDPLTQLGVDFNFLQNSDSLPYSLHGNGFKGGHVTINASQSSQFLSALLLVGCYGEQDLVITLDGDLAARPYIEMTIQMMADFGVEVVNRDFQHFEVPCGQMYHGMNYAIEPDASNAGYFLAMAVLSGGSALVQGVHLDSLQGDIKFVEALKQLGSRVEEHPEGLWLQGPAGGVFPGIDIDMGGMPDQTMTLAALAPFATSTMNIRNISLIKYHESNRVEAIIHELARLGIHAEETETGIKIEPGTPVAAEIETYDDHRMAMAFSLIGLRVPGVRIKNPGCTAKTFGDYFERFRKAVEQRI